ncbi:response regulator transcription factor [bacterium]|nr:response regulator transcription factor [bacterium]
MALRTIIVEDEAPSRERLKSLLEAIPEVELIGEAGDGPGGAELIDALKPDLVFLDVQLPVFTGFTLLQRIRHRPYVIFVTAYDAFAIRAFEANAVDYLLKPTSAERLREAVSRVRQRDPHTRQIMDVLQSVLNQNKYRQRFSVKIGEEVILIASEDIDYFRADDKYVFLHAMDKAYLIEETLKGLETCLDPARFIRIHKSVIINIESIVKIRRRITGQYQVLLKDTKNPAFDIGRTYLARVRERLEF